MLPAAKASGALVRSRHAELGHGVAVATLVVEEQDLLERHAGLLGDLGEVLLLGARLESVRVHPD